MKQVIQGFATALVLAGAIMLYFHYNEVPNSENTASAAVPVQTNIPNTDEMKKELEKNGLHVLEDKEYEQLQQKQSEPAAKPEQKPEKQKKTFTLELKSGMTSEDVATTLEKAAIIEDGSAFRTYLDITEASESLQVGKYDVNSEMQYKDLVNLMTK